MKKIKIIAISIILFILATFFLSFAFLRAMKEGAMAVYKGNAKLEYKVVDGIKIDSCVIFVKK